MTTNAPGRTDSLRRDLQASWHRFLDLFEPLRPELYRYCRHLTRSPWDADDLAQDSLFRAFAKLGCMNEPPPNPRAWLFRVASNLWIDRARAARSHTGALPESASFSEPRDVREAAGTLLSRLSPQERAAVVLKEAFNFTLEEIAEALSTSTGTVKSALHRGRGKLVDPEEREEAPPRPPVLDEFCAAFNAADLDRLTALLLETAEIEVVRVHAEVGPEAARRGVFQGMLFGTRRMADPVRLDGLDPQFFQGALAQSPRVELRQHRGEWISVHWYAHADGEAVRAITRIDTDGAKLSRVRNYFYTPDVLAEICAELKLPFRSNGYRYWKPEEEGR
ncbi:MAG TPA: RNA polymerase sigma factor [Myxococcales bacterium]|jgi:RNA polymerase sigma-70 factor (ECF subfamily)|nr:RNA polymerase sigma factor [Myxococcales bacterium]